MINDDDRRQMMTDALAGQKQLHWWNTWGIVLFLVTMAVSWVSGFVCGIIATMGNLNDHQSYHTLA